VLSNPIQSDFKLYGALLPSDMVLADKLYFSYNITLYNNIKI